MLRKKGEERGEEMKLGQAKGGMGRSAQKSLSLSTFQGGGGGGRFVPPGQKRERRGGGKGT